MIEGAILPQTIADSFDAMEFGPMTKANPSFSEMLKCMSKQVNYNHPEVETVNVRNFKSLACFCGFLFILAFMALVLENIHKKLEKQGYNSEI